MKKLSLFALKLVVVALVVGAYSSTARAAWGDLDASFGFGGYAYDGAAGHLPHSVALQPDGKILVTGHRVQSHLGVRFFLRRYLANGNIDTSFGTNGVATTPESNTFSTDYRGDSIVVFPNGKIAVAGWANGSTAVWQFLANGRNDKTFGTDGLQVLAGYPVMNNGYPELNIQSGKLLLTLRKTIGADGRVVLVRLTSSSALDTTFFHTGEAPTDVDADGQGSDNTLIEPDGKITVGGVKYFANSVKGLERKLVNGQVDQNFPQSTLYSYNYVANPGLTKTVNGKYIMRGANISGAGITMYFEKYSSQGIYESLYTPFSGFPAGNCPVLAASQSDGKVIQHWPGIMMRADAEITPGAADIWECATFSGLTDISRAVLQPNDRMIVAANYGGSLYLVRTMP